MGSGTKRSILSEPHGLLLGIVVAGANGYGLKLAVLTLEAFMVARPTPTAQQPVRKEQGACKSDVRTAMTRSGWGIT